LEHRPLRLLIAAQLVTQVLFMLENLVHHLTDDPMSACFGTLLILLLGAIRTFDLAHHEVLLLKPLLLGQREHHCL
jgi:hypothetical protein